MKPRIDPKNVSQEPMKAMFALGKYLAECGLDVTLLSLIKVRASQINGCAYCIDMHTKDARAEGETEQRLYALSAWRETPFFTDRERAALAWTEAVTLIRDGVSDELFEATQDHFNEKEIADLTWAVVAINAWNRVSISGRAVPGNYQPGKKSS